MCAIQQPECPEWAHEDMRYNGLGWICDGCENESCDCDKFTMPDADEFAEGLDLSQPDTVTAYGMINDHEWLNPKFPGYMLRIEKNEGGEEIRRYMYELEED